MRISSPIVCIVLSLFGAVCAGQDSYKQSELLVKFKPGTWFLEQAAHVSVGSKVVDIIPGIGVSHVRIRAGLNLASAKRFYEAQDTVEYVELNAIGEFSYTPNDPKYGDQYGPQRIQCPNGWDISLGIPSVVIGVVDSGVDSLHPDLKTKLLPGKNMLDGTTNVTDVLGHGTHVCGILGAATDNGIGIAGVAPNCKMIPIKIGDLNPDQAATAAGIVYAADQGAKIVQLSLTIPDSKTLSDACNYAFNKGLLIVCAAGNNNSKTITYPGGYSNVMAIGSTDNSDIRSPFSNFGPWVTVAAPGSNILSTWIGQGYNTISGTSMAAPHVSGLAALVWSYSGPTLTNSELRVLIESNTDPVPGDPFSHGRINVWKTLVAAPAPKTTVTIQPNFVSMTFGGGVTGALSDVVAVDGSYFEVKTVRQPQAGLRAGAQTTFTLTRQRDRLDSMTVTIVSRAAYHNQASKATTNVAFAYNYSKRAWELLGLFTVSTSNTRKDFKFPGNGQAYVGPNGEVAVQSWLNLPDRLVTPNAYIVYRWDMSSLSATFKG